MTLPIEGCDYYIYVIRLPKGIHAMVMPNDDATFSVYLDASRTFLQRIDDWEHELWHIIRDDFYNDKPIWVVERR